MDSLERSADIRTRISSLKSEWDRVQPLSAENEARLWRKLRLDWNYHSNHIEGNTLTYGETELLLISGKTTGQHDIREFEEMKAHDVAIQHVRDLATDISRQLTEGDVRDLNKILLKEPFWKEAITQSGAASRKQIIPGDYKTTPNNVRTSTGEIFEFATPEETPRQMQELVAWFRDQLESADADLIRVLAAFHHRFSVIHPFDDGNGRTMRLLVNYALMRKGWMPIVIRTQDKKTYLGALSAADAGDLVPFTEFLELQVERSLELGLKAARGEELEEPEDWKKEMELFVRGNVAGDFPAQALSAPLIERWLSDSLLLLTNEIVTKLAPLKKVFAVVGYKLKGVGAWGLDIPFVPSNWAEIVREFVRYTSTQPCGAWLVLELRAFSGAATPPFDLDVDLLITLNQFNYSLSRSGISEEMPPFRYDIPLSKTQVEQLSTSIAKHVFEQVKAKATPAP
ncbi:MAG TPA: Fic family protein [Prosthecobacter sp.]